MCVSSIFDAGSLRLLCLHVEFALFIDFGYFSAFTFLSCIEPILTLFAVLLLLIFQMNIVRIVADEFGCFI